jgi:hypothetical protein
VIEENYTSPTAFENGILHNAAGENSGSCKLFSLQKYRTCLKQQRCPVLALIIKKTF